MTWAQFDDNWYEHPHFTDLSLAALGLWSVGKTYCNRLLTDGRIPQSFVARWSRSGRAAVAELLKFGRWAVNEDGSYQHVGYLDHNPSKGEVLRRKAELHEKRSKAGHAGGKQSAEARAKQLASTDPSKTQAPVEALSSPLHSLNKQTKDKHLSATPPVPTPPSASRVRADDGTDRVYAHWVRCRAPHVAGAPPKLTPARRAMLRARLAEDFTVDQLIAAATGIWSEAWNLEDIPKRISFEICFRNAGQVERYGGKAAPAPPPPVWRPRVVESALEPKLGPEQFAAESGVTINPLLASALGAGDERETQAS